MVANLSRNIEARQEERRGEEKRRGEMESGHSAVSGREESKRGKRFLSPTYKQTNKHTRIRK
jgi:hypothetical protein